MKEIRTRTSEYIPSLKYNNQITKVQSAGSPILIFLANKV